jgi:thiamine-monophosphate kinase
MINRDTRLPGEFELIAEFLAPLAAGYPDAFGLLDDAAVIAPSPGHELVAKTDALVSGVHFLPDDPADLVARKALRVNLSDLAGKGAVARAYMLDLILPHTTTRQWMAAFAAGLAADQAEFAVHLIGGDTNATPGPLTLAIMALGEVKAGAMLRRKGASVGDRVLVTGTLGDAALGLKALREELSGIAGTAAGFLADRYRLPRPRVSVGPRLVGLASASIDISDGLIADMRHICDVSVVSAVIETARVPLSPAARTVILSAPSLLTAALTGGDDYEILFTAPPDAAGALARLAQDCAIPITEIGRIEALSDSHLSERDRVQIGSRVPVSI